MNRRTFITGLLATTALPAAVPTLAQPERYSVDVFVGRTSLGEPAGSVSISPEVWSTTPERTALIPDHVRHQIHEWVSCDGTRWWPDDIAYSVETDAAGEVVVHVG